MDKVIVLDFGSQYTQLIARKIRELGVFSEILPFSVSTSRLKRENPAAIILSGGPQSVDEEEAPLAPREIFEMGIPVLGICYGLQLMAYILGGKVVPSKRREYGLASCQISRSYGRSADLPERCCYPSRSERGWNDG